MAHTENLLRPKRHSSFCHWKPAKHYPKGILLASPVSLNAVTIPGNLFFIWMKEQGKLPILLLNFRFISRLLNLKDPIPVGLSAKLLSRPNNGHCRPKSDEKCYPD
ncbi:hypothetical protein MLD38_023549 [Melastoma candidum]|uniref:Uncharacterized protein n=1 Tax=Melastoma candidum TaxID=119954 RepID=A0ACB9NSY3_9MYRT|nr:hypothetical protein MLD38_023549 [Melastoma candidum]